MSLWWNKRDDQFEDLGGWIGRCYPTRCYPTRSSPSRCYPTPCYPSRDYRTRG